MKRWLLCALALASLDAGAACQPTTAPLDDMAEAGIVLAGPGERRVRLRVRVADDHRERAAGFQHICPETIETTAIYFVFERPRRPSFHMHNVKAPLDIAFIDADGVIVSIQRMEPYVVGAREQKTYGPQAEVAGALEARAGYFSGEGITENEWRVELLEP